MGPGSAAFACCGAESPVCSVIPSFMQEIKWRDLNSRKDPSRAQTFHWTERQPQLDLYAILEVSPTASPEVIRAAYRVLIEKHHPDKNPEPRRHFAEEISRELNHAYSILSDPQKRRTYDHAHSIYRRP